MPLPRAARFVVCLLASLARADAGDINPNMEKGTRWDPAYTEEKLREQGYTSYCPELIEGGLKLVVDYKAWDAGFDYEMKLPKVYQRFTLSPGVHCPDAVCAQLALHANGTLPEATPELLGELKGAVRTAVCTYENPKPGQKSADPRVEYSPATKTMTFVLTRSMASPDTWFMKFFTTPAGKKSFPLMNKYLASH